MHIPDGYLGPVTYGFLYAVMIPLWILASKIAKKSLNTKQIPILALGTAFSFVIMMFNIPIPGGTTGHAVGSVLISIILGPWAALIAISIALFVQALFFGDGGITALGANCFNMAFIMPFSGYYIYKIISNKSDLSSKRRWIGAGVGGYLGLNLAALFTGIEFGLQPLLHKTAQGQALYGPYPLKIAVPIMSLEHIIVFGWVEAIVTMLVIKYLQKQKENLFYENSK